MKVLYLTHPEQDYGEYYLFNGLCQILGNKNVVTYPYKKSYYGQVDNEYILDDGNKGFTAPGDYCIAKEPNEWDFNEVINRFGEFSFVVLSSGRTYAVKALRDLMKIFGNTFPLIFTEHEDGDNIRWDIINEFKPHIMFKRESLLEVSYQNVFPLPFSSAIDSFPKVDDSQKKYDVFALFGMTYPIRREVIEKLLEMNYPNTYLGVDTKGLRGDLKEKNHCLVGYKEYLTGIAQSKIAISVRGHGRDCCRFWEIPAYETLMLMVDPGIEIPHKFEDGVHVVYFKQDLSDLQEKIDYYLVHDDERKEIAKAGKQHLLKYHTNKARAQYFLDIVLNKLELK